MTQSLTQTDGENGQVWYPLSAAQQQLWFFSHMEADSRAYNIGGCLWLEGPLDMAVLRDVLHAVVDRNEMLRATFRDFQGRPAQMIRPMQPIEIDLVDLSDQENAEQLAVEQGHQLILDVYNITEDELFRQRLYRIAPDRHMLAMACHHIVADAWAFGVLLREMISRYESVVCETKLRLPRLTRSYFDVVLKQQEWLKSDKAATQAEYWRDYLGDQHSPLSLPTQRASNSVELAQHQLLPVDAGLVAQLDNVADELEVSRFTLLLGALHLVLARLSGQDEIRIGVPNANRSARTAAVYGFFVNNWVIAAKPQAQLSLKDFILQVGAALDGAKAHGQLPFESLLEVIEPERHPGCHPLFQAAFNYRHRHQGGEQAWDINGLTMRFDEMPAYETPFSLVLDISPSLDDGLMLRFITAKGVFSEDLVDQLSQGYRRALRQLAELQRPSLAAMDILSEDDHRTLQNWSTQPYDYEQGQTLPELIAAQAASRPDAVALVHGDTRIRFAELEARSNQLAHWLIAQGIGTDQVVGLSLPRGVEMIIGFLGVLKAGGAFLPLDPDYPQERLCYMLEDSGAKLLLTNKALLNALPVDGLRRVALDDLDLIHQPDNTPRIQLHADQLAYLIYTSGSTGKPKGVCLTHAGLNMHVQTIGERYGMTPEDVELHFASISFDGAVERWTVPLAFGSRLVIRDQQLWSAEETCQALQREGVTIACFPPSYVGPLLDWIEHSQPQLKVRSWTLGGEAFTRETYERLQQVLKPRRIINGYGPTETVVTPMIWEAYADTDMDSAYAPIGTAVGERRLYILDGNLNPVAPGIVGELYIGGEIGLARGYHGRPDLTAERFLPDPWGEAGERMYRTGDLVRWREDGVMEYQGRVDHQIKIRGFRIELGEIEARLLANPQVAEATVVAQAAPGGDRLVGYVVPKGPLDLEQLKGDLESALPDYMVPSQILSLDSLPLTPAGKVDRAALPQAQWQQQEYEAPQSEAEKALASIWAQLLGVERIGRQDQFLSWVVIPSSPCRWSAVPGRSAGRSVRVICLSNAT